MVSWPVVSGKCIDILDSTFPVLVPPLPLSFGPTVLKLDPLLQYNITSPCVAVSCYYYCYCYCPPESECVLISDSSSCCLMPPWELKLSTYTYIVLLFSMIHIRYPSTHDKYLLPKLQPECGCGILQRSAIE